MAGIALGNMVHPTIGVMVYYVVAIAISLLVLATPLAEIPMHKPAKAVVAEGLESRFHLAGAPIILKVSDAVRPGGLININGGGIDAAGLDVAIAPDTSGQGGATPPANAVHPQILQTDVNGQFAVCKFPGGAAPGVYSVWVRNASGWSSPSAMNAARALYTSDYQAFAGVNIEVVGRNFDEREFGGNLLTQVRLNSGTGGIYSQTVANVNPCEVTFTVGATAPLGTYYIEVSNDGVHWSRPSSGQTLAIVAHAGSDPLGLGVSWAQDFKWNQVFNATAYGATGSDTNDDTSAVQNAVNAAQAAGGGIVYFPNGSYYVSEITLSPGVVLEGQDEYATKLYYDGTGGSAMIHSPYSGTAQLQGVARLSILLKDPNIRPDVFMLLGDWLGGGLDSRTANRIFVANINLSYDYTSGFSQSAASVNDSAAGITYSGSWSYATGHSGDYQNDIHYTTSAGSYFQYSFTGTTIYYIAETGPTSGNVDVYLDGALKATVNCYSATTQTNRNVYPITSNTWGSHTLKIVNHDTGKTMLLDELTSLTPVGNGLLVNGDERVLVQNNTFKGWAATASLDYVRRYFTIRNNSFEFSDGLLHSTATYSFVESNTLIAHPEYNRDTHGVFTRADSYVANNTVAGTGDASNAYNDGEAFSNEGPNGEFNYGSVVSATSTSLIVSSKLPLTNPTNLEYGELSVMITGGTGLGQLRKVSVNPATSTLTLTADQPFAIVPDSTSKWTLLLPLKGYTVYHNTMSNCAQGIVPFGNQFDAVIADNTGTNTCGVFMWAARSSDGSTYANDTANAYVRITRNNFSGVSRRTNQGGIGVYTGRFDGAKFYDVLTYSTEITDNVITGNNTRTPTSGWPPFSGIFVCSYGYSNMSDGTGTGDATNTLIAGNRLSNLQTGISLTKCDYGQVISSNAYDGAVLRLLLDSATGSFGKSDNTLVTPDNVLIPNAPAQALLTVDDGTAQRSMIRSLTIRFDEPVWLASNAVALSMRGGSPLAATVAIVASSDFTTFTLSFSETGIVGGSLSDGAYRLSVDPALVHDFYNQGLTGAARLYRFHRLFGDSDGDRDVDRSDIIAFRTAMASGSNVVNYDYNGDGIVNAIDYRQLKLHVLRRLL